MILNSQDEGGLTTACNGRLRRALRPGRYLADTLNFSRRSKSVDEKAETTRYFAADHRGLPGMNAALFSEAR